MSNEVHECNQVDEFYKFTTKWEHVSNSSTVLDNFKTDQLLVISEILIGEDILEIKFEQVVKYPLKNTNSMDHCSFCSKKAILDGDEKKLPRCSKCYRSAYCNSECQKKDWIKHNNLLCSKPLDSVGVPTIITILINQIDTIETLKKILTEVGFHSIEINNHNNLDKNMEFIFLNESNNKIEKLENQEDLLQLKSLKNRSAKIQVKWNNNSDAIKIKTSLKKFKSSREPVAQTNNVNLTDCLNLFTKSEKLSSENPWFCSKCKKHQEATKQMNIWRLPKYLIITLKRFQATKASESFSTLNSGDLAYKYMMMNPRISSILQNRLVYNKLNTEVNFPIR